MNKRPVSYLQCDPKWGKNDYSAKGETCTICSAGCGPTSAAMAAAEITGDENITPATAVKWSLAHGGKALRQGTYYSFFTPFFAQYGIMCTQLNTANLRDVGAAKAAPYHEKAFEAVKSGDVVIACMGSGLWTTGGHFILWYGVEGQNVLINDPASERADRLKNTLAKLQSEVKYYFVITVPKKPDEPIKYTVEMTDVKLSVNGKTVSVKGYNLDGRVFVGVREYEEQLGGILGWDDTNKVVTISRP